MTSFTLSTAAIAVLLTLAGASFIGTRTLSRTLLGGTALLLAGIEVVDQAVLARLGNPLPALRPALLLESLLPAVLLAYSFCFARSEQLRLLSPRGALISSLAVLFPAAAVLPSLLHARIGPQALVLLFLALTISTVAALVNIEATFASSSGSDRWKIKFEVVGMGAVLVVLVVFFSQALLYRTINARLLPLRSAVFAVGGMLVLLARLLPSHGVRVSVSRVILERSLTLVAAGVYFILLGVVSRTLHYFHVPADQAFTLVFAVAAACALLFAFLSAPFRRRFRVFVNKHFFAHKHDYRETWLNLTARMAGCASRAELEEAIPAAFRRIFGLDRAHLYLLNTNSGSYLRARTAGGEGLPLLFTPSPELLSYFRDRNRVWNPVDREYPARTEEAAFAAQAAAAAVVPLLCNGQVEALVVFGRPAGETSFTFEDYDLMKLVARQSALLLNNQRLSAELVETRELAAMARVSSFVLHDLKNLAHTLSLVTDNADRHLDNTDFQRDMVSAVRRTVGTMKHLIQRLRMLPRPGVARCERSDLRVLSQSVLAGFARRVSKPALHLRGGSVHSLVDVEEFRKVLENLVQNAIDATGGDGEITVETGIIDGRACVSVTDTGHGMPREFIERDLFRPFRTTKKTGLGIGLYQCRQIVESFRGTIEVTSEAGRGTTFIVQLPLLEAALVEAA